MPHMNIEIKARLRDADAVRRVLRERGARFVGLDHQIDTYFNCTNGRLKLRQGNIETALIHYHRPDQPGPKQADVHLCRLDPAAAVTLRQTLAEAVGVLVAVDKHREIYFIDNVKFHIDQVQTLGQFVEIEAIDEHGTQGRENLLTQCQQFIQLLNIQEADLLTNSYSDMLLHQ